MKPLKTWFKEKAYGLALESFRLRMSAALRLQRYVSQVCKYAVSILGIGLAVALYHPVAKEALSHYENLDALFVACGALIGTVLALVFSLSIIPIQRAAEQYTPSVMRLYSRDLPTHLIFISMAVFCLLSFVMAIDQVMGVDSQNLLPFQILLVAATFDMLRFYHRRTIQLLQATEAIERLLKMAKKYMDRIQKTANHLSRIQIWFLSAEKRKALSKNQLESLIYCKVLSGHPIMLKRWTDELTEIAQKSIGNGEAYTTRLAVSAMTKVVGHYLTIRKNNLVLVPEDIWGTLGSDVHSLLKPVYENLKNINRNAVELKHEDASIMVIEAFSAIAIETVQLKSPVFPTGKAPITWLPIRYLEDCIETAQKQGLQDAGLQGSYALLNIARASNEIEDPADVHIPLADGWKKIATFFFAFNQGILVNEPSDCVMMMAHYLVHVKHPCLNLILIHILEAFEHLMPLALASEKISGSAIVGLPLSAPYDLTNEKSIGHLVERAKLLIEPKDDKNWVSPYHRFIEFDHTVYRHFRNIAEKVDFGASFLLWHIIQTIKFICLVHLKILKEPTTTIRSHNEELSKQVGWHLSFFWVNFSKATTINIQRAEEACDALSFLGLSFLEAGYQDPFEVSANNIVSIVESYCKFAGTPNPYDVADLLMNIRYMYMVAEKRKDAPAMDKIRKAMSKPKNLMEDQWPDVQEALEHRKNQLAEHLDQIHTPFMTPPHEAMGLLKSLLA